jgi:hypothetical protein
MADTAYLARLKERKADLEAKLKRLATLDPKTQPDLATSKIATQNGIAQIDSELKRQSPALN